MKQGKGGMLAALSLVGLMLTGVGAAAAKGRAPCPPKDHAKLRHCLVVLAKQTTPRRLARLVALFKKERVEASAAARHVELQANAKEVWRLFGAKFVYRRTARSARRGFICNAYLTRVRLPRRYRGLIASVAVGHQICE